MYLKFKFVRNNCNKTKIKFTRAIKKYLTLSNSYLFLVSKKSHVTSDAGYLDHESQNREIFRVFQLYVLFIADLLNDNHF